MSDENYTRLYITPLNPSLLNTILPASILPHARNISYHSIQTFPDKGYGYVELPLMDAEKIKKKLHGSILKGTKVRIENARLPKEIILDPAPAEVPERPKPLTKRRKRNELPGIYIGERHVKRGWTTPVKDVGKKRDRDWDRSKGVKGREEKTVKSKYTTGPECLFKTVLPANVASKIKPKTADTILEKKRKEIGKQALVHEFERTTKYALFLKGSSATKGTKAVTEFVEGKGWFDADGNLVEEVRKSKRLVGEEGEVWKSEAGLEIRAEAQTEAPVSGIEGSVSASRGNFLEDESSEEESDPRAIDDEATTTKAAPQLSGKYADGPQLDTVYTLAVPSRSQESKPYSSGLDSSSESEAEAGADRVERATVNINLVTSTQSSSDSNSSSGSVSASTSTFSSQAKTKQPASDKPTLPHQTPLSHNHSLSIQIHPLEALYKKNGKPDDASFTFFDSDVASEQDLTITQLTIPLTPFTQRDFERRRIRSAAPTPDTAHMNSRFRQLERSVEVDDDDGDDDDAIAKLPENKPGPELECDFQKWFWQNRGNFTRAWKKRRKTVIKEMRQKDKRRKKDPAV